ncbi:MAG: efflux RND transporter periplasmic adaptor subunit, partial [Gammaproteobacteria bacterium]|nr:efflux RND transporter periplasmic adaptor subunit [Gammaproteobacteria bacterium]
MKIASRKLVPLAILGALGLIALLINANPPEVPQRAPFTGPQMVVDTLPVMRRDYQVLLQSYGTVQPRTQTTLIAQVGGQIVAVNPNVRDGGFFEKGDVLASIDSRDYEADVRIAEAALMDARQALAEAEARTVQAKEDWERLGNAGEAPELVLRLPQLEAARARVISAQSALQKSKLDLERTDIVAPFAGRILRKLADIGQVVTVNTPLAEIYATDSVEIRLPLKNRDLGFIELPERYRNSAATAPAATAVTIRSELFGGDSWDAELIRTEGAIDESARQLHVIAQINDPFSHSSEDRAPLKIGQYVTAELTGKQLSDVLVIPNTAIYQGSYVYVVEDGLLQRRVVDIAWQNDDEAIISDGLQHGDALVTTSLGQVTSGIRVSTTG